MSEPMKGTLAIWYPRNVPQFETLDLAQGVLMALAGKNHDKYLITDRTVIGAHKDDGRAGWVTEVHYKVLP